MQEIILYKDGSLLECVKEFKKQNMEQYFAPNVAEIKTKLCPDYDYLKAIPDGSYYCIFSIQISCIMKCSSPFANTNDRLTNL